MGHLGPENVRKKFAGMVKRCADSGFDLAAGKVEVVPTAHYFMGGVVVDPDTRTAMEGLYVAGEDAGGAHGSNRLGGNGVANSTVFGGIAGDVMGVDVRRIGRCAIPTSRCWPPRSNARFIRSRASPQPCTAFATSFRRRCGRM
ncbi:FAD-binding protein [Paracoccus cavernae]|uniref:L-aspartate oxidase n=1 Tax=Paracoccus cavernae TaxID=1571207 RepID=A0ABT8DCJ0_9RHOB|nr:FAD-binding protein [Paracoccus cavernae]